MSDIWRETSELPCEFQVSIARKQMLIMSDAEIELSVSCTFTQDIIQLQPFILAHTGEAD